MNDLDVLSRRLDELGRRAPVPEADPLLDIRRGRAALLRRRRARNAAAIATTITAVVGIVVATPLLGGPGHDAPGAGEVTFQPASPSASTPADQAAPPLCSREWAMSMDGQQALDQVRERHHGDDGVGHLYGPGMLPKPWKDPALAPALASYRQAVAETLDPSGRHLDRKVTNVQSSCGEDGLVRLGTKLGWRSGDAVGLIQVEIVAPHHEEQPQIVMDHDRWAAYDGVLPAGVHQARVADDGDGHAVVVERDDGLTVAVGAAGVWGNNAAPGSPSAGDLPTVEEILALAASPSLTLPGP